jgi:protein-S-isoprenylcysteine O-methyltransferase Ste14
VSPVSSLLESSTPLVRVGGWLFRHRTALPIPLAIPLLFLRAGEAEPGVALLVCGVALVTMGELVRVWGVHHIGAVSRTRSDRLGPLVATGPFAVVRNPLYLGNIAIWVGLAFVARLLWMAPLILVVLAFEYHAIVRWEEQLLESRLGDSYRAYLARVPRWIPTLHHGGPSAFSSVADFSWWDTLFSERGTLIAIALGSLALWLKLKT